MGFEIETIDEAETATLAEWVESHDTALVIVPVGRDTRLQAELNLMRELRVPYLFVRAGQSFECRTIGVGITRLEEDKEKGPYIGSFARNFNSRIRIYKPRDYGHGAERNIEAVTALLATQGLTAEIIPGRKDSSGIELESIAAPDDLTIISASRDYGLDDLIFGPKERHIIRRATHPVLVINPRGDLYPLCD